MSNLFYLNNKESEQGTNTSSASASAWEHALPEDKELLLRVEAEVLDFHDLRFVAEQHERKQRRWLWWSVPAMAGVMAILLFFNFSGATPPPLQLHGGLKLTKAARETKQNRLLTLHHAATVHDPQGWSLKAHNATPVHIQRPSSRVSIVSFRRGALSFAVRPGSMKKFVVRCRGDWKVVVKGTRFLVWQTKQGIRVEVSRGHVLLTHKGQEKLHLYKGQAVFLKDAGKTTQLQTYKLPSRGENWLAKVESLARTQPSLLFGYVQELSRSRLFKKSQRTQLLETAAHALKGVRRYRESSLLWLELFRLSRLPLAKQTALFNAAETCRMEKTRQQRCLSLYKRLLRQYPTAVRMVREFSLSRLVQLEPSRASEHMKAYLKAYPTGVFAHQYQQRLHSLKK